MMATPIKVSAPPTHISGVTGVVLAAGTAALMLVCEWAQTARLRRRRKDSHA